MRIHFVVRLSSIQIRLHPKHELKWREKVKNLHLEINFANYKKLLFTDWTVVLPHLSTTQEESAAVETWVEKHYPTRSQAYLFRYRTDYPESMEPKKLRVSVSQSWKHPPRVGDSLLGEATISLRTVATGPEEYHFTLELTKEGVAADLGQVAVIFTCQMHQECMIKYKIRSLACCEIPPLPAAILNHPNAFWFQPSFTVDVWYVTSEQMTFATRLETHFYDPKKRYISWKASQVFYINDTTDMLEKAHLFLQISYNDRPWTYSLISLFHTHDPQQDQYFFPLPLFFYHAFSEPHVSTPPPTFLFMEISQGPSFWQMQEGMATETKVCSGLIKAHFPIPNMQIVMSNTTQKVKHANSHTPEIVQTITKFAPHFVIPSHHINEGEDSTTKNPQEEEQVALIRLDDSLKALLQCYKNRGQPTDQILEHLSRVLHSI